jgi:GNAT superfamily N-acetyltransferase
VNVRPATAADEQVLRELWEELEEEVPAPPEDVETWEEEWADVSADIDGRGAVYLAEDDEGVAGTVRTRMRRGDVWHIASAYVRPRARNAGVLKRLLEAAITEGRTRGSSRVTLDVLVSNPQAVVVWQRLGFESEKHTMAVPLDVLAARLDAGVAPSTGTLFVQTDDETKVEQSVAKYLPRIGHSEKTTVVPPANGWIRVDDELADRDPRALRRLAREISLALGAIVLTLGIEEGAVVRYVIWDRGGIADEYASVPEYFGPLPPGDVIALGANPTVAQRLTGADPGRVRAVAVTAASPAELPPPEQLLAQLAAALGVGSGS